MEMLYKLESAMHVLGVTIKGGQSGLGWLGRWSFSCPFSPSGTNTANHTWDKKLKVSSSVHIP